MKQHPRRPADLFTSVWADHAHLVRRATFHFCQNNAALTDDLVAAGMVGLWQSWKKYDAAASGPVGLWGFAHTRVLGAMRDHLRAIDPTTRSERERTKHQGKKIPERQLVSLELADELPGHDPGALHELVAQQASAAVREGLLALPRSNAELLLSRYFDEKTHLQIARERGFTESRSCQIEHASLQKLRAVLEDDPRLEDASRRLPITRRS